MADVSELDVPLATAIEALRRELVAAVQEGADQEVRFALGPIELEFQVEVSREAGVEAGVKFWVVSLGGKGSRTTGKTHTVRLSLSPVLASDVGRDVPLVVGSERVRRPR
jgi:Trypsin-co-occurring domain 2